MTKGLAIGTLEVLTQMIPARVALDSRIALHLHSLTPEARARTIDRIEDILSRLRN